MEVREHIQGKVDKAKRRLSLFLGNIGLKPIRIDVTVLGINDGEPSLTGEIPSGKEAWTEQEAVRRAAQAGRQAIVQSRNRRGLGID